MTEPRTEQPQHPSSDRGVPDGTAFREAFRRRDAEAWAVVVQRFSEPLQRRISCMLHSAMDRDEAFSRTWLKALLYVRAFDPRTRLGPWLNAICFHVCCEQRSRYRRLRQLSARGQPVEEAAPSPPLFDGRTAVQHALATLPSEDREVLTLRYICDLSYPEVARLLALELPTVRQRVARALARLRCSPEAHRLSALSELARWPSEA